MVLDLISREWMNCLFIREHMVSLPSRFEYAGWQQKVTAIETGVVIDVYPKSLPLMADSKKNSFLIFMCLCCGEQNGNEK